MTRDAAAGVLALAGVALSYRETLFVIASTSESETNGVVQVSLPFSVCNRGDTCVTVAVSFDIPYAELTSICEGVEAFPDTTDLGVVVHRLGIGSVVQLPIHIQLNTISPTTEMRIEVRLSTGISKEYLVEIRQRYWNQVMAERSVQGDFRYLHDLSTGMTSAGVVVPFQVSHIGQWHRTVKPVRFTDCVRSTPTVPDDLSVVNRHSGSFDASYQLLESGIKS